MSCLRPGARARSWLELLRYSKTLGRRRLLASPATNSTTVCWSSMFPKRPPSTRTRMATRGRSRVQRESEMRITLGVTGGVAAYKAAELVRRLQQEGHSVQVVMTRSAREFVTPLTFAALSGQKVITGLFSDSSGGEANLESAIEHIAVAQRTDLLLVAPATADIIAKFARGVADDFLTTLYLALTAPVVVAPAMNVNMWNHAATRENVETLRARGVKIVEPDEGYLACGMTGPGRLAGLEEILAAFHDVTKAHRDLEGETILVSAG